MKPHAANQVIVSMHFSNQIKNASTSIINTPVKIKLYQNMRLNHQWNLLKVQLDFMP